jgi:hypothetical protein
MEFDGSEWRDVTPRMITDIRRRIAELELLVKIYEARNDQPSAELRLVGGRNRRAGP